MPIIAADWSLTRIAGGLDVRYIGDDHGGASPSYATVIELHRWMQGLADDALSVGDDELDITDQDPTSRSTDNIITLLGNTNIDDNAAEHLYDGTIIQLSGATIYDGVVNFGNAGVVIQLIQNGAVLADDWWNSNGGLNADAQAGISHRFMIKVRDAGADIDGRRVIGTTREIGKTSAEFPINGTSRGNNVLALSNSNDLNNQTLEATIAGWNDITNLQEGYVGIDVNNDGAPEFYYSNWDIGVHPINDLYERAKWLTRDGSTETLYGLNGELFRGITHEIDVDTPTGTFNAFEPVSWAGGTGQMLAIDSPTGGTKLWMQLLTGVAPTDGQTITGGTSGGTVDVNTNVVTYDTPDVFVGASTGSSIIGAYGLGVEATDLNETDQLFDLSNTSQSPPNFATFNVTGLVIGEDRVLVFPWDGASLDTEGNPAIDRTQLTLNAALSGAAVTSVVTATPIPLDTPASGDIRIVADDGRNLEVPYTSWIGSTFTIPAFDFSGINVAAAGNGVWIAYIDLLSTATTESFVAVFSGNRQVGVRVRDGGGTPIKEFITSSTYTAAGGNVGAIRTSDL